MSNITLAEILGWEEGKTYRFDGAFYRVKNNSLEVQKQARIKSRTYWESDGDTIINKIGELMNAEKVECNRYFLKHRYFSSGHSFLNRDMHRDNKFFMDDNNDSSGLYQTQFTNEEIEKIEATGFDLRNFEKVEAEDND